MSFNPKRLELARRRRGMSKRGLAEASGLSVRTISYHEDENSDHEPSDETLDALCRALRFPPSFFYRQTPEPLPEGAVSFRALSRMTAAQRDRALGGGELAIELNSWIEGEFVLPDPDVPDLRHEKTPEDAAIRLRSHWSLGDKPIPNMVHLLESRGVRMFSLAENCGSVDAFSFWRAGTAFIFLNGFKSSERSRFDAAHELGHLAMHGHGSPSGRKAEHEADQFAAAFLMPRSNIVAHKPNLHSLPGLISAKERWGVSVGALARRMNEVGVLSDWHYRQICIDISQHGFRKMEPNEMPRETSQILQKVLTTLWNEKVSPAKLAERLGWPQEELEALTFNFVTIGGKGADLIGGGEEPALRIV